jgi:hypothetical protein
MPIDDRASADRITEPLPSYQERWRHGAQIAIVIDNLHAI